jgi:hypothetical protein
MDIKNVGYASLRDVDAIRYNLLTENDKMVYFVDVSGKRHEINLNMETRQLLKNEKKIWIFMEKSNKKGIFIELL